MGMTVSALRYLGQIWWKIPGSWKQKKKILSCVATPVRDYAERNPDGGYDAIVLRFGEPERIAESYLEELDISDIRKQLAIRKKIVVIISLSAICIVLLWAGVVFAALIHNHTQNGGNVYIESVIEVEERIPIEEEN